MLHFLSPARLWQDIKYGCRTLASSPGFSAVAILSLALGVGANCAIFSFADALLLRPLPVSQPGELYTVGSVTAVEAFGASSIVSSYPDYVDIRDRSKTIDGLVAMANVTAGFAPNASATPKLKLGMLASGNLFSVMGVSTEMGRPFGPEDDRVPGRDAVVVLGHTMWEQEFGSDPTVIGREVRLDGHPFTIIGVAQASFTGVNPMVRSDFFVPMMMSAQLLVDPRAASLNVRDARNLTLKGRLAHGATQAAAQAELTTIGNDLARAYPDTNKNRRLAIRTELQARMGEDPPDATLVEMLATLAGLVLLVACANVAGLLTSRAPARAKEMALRLAIGAGRAQLIRQLFVESLLIAVAAGVVGLGVGYAGMTLFRQIELPTDLPINLAFRMDARVLIASLIVALVSTVLFGLSPAIQAVRTDLTAVMKAGDAVAPGNRRRWGRAVLVCGQVAVSVIVLSVAVFMYRGFGQQLADGPGYRRDHLLMISFDTSLVRYSDAQAQTFFKDVADRARMQPGVTKVAMATAIPMWNDTIRGETVVPEGFQFPAGKDNATVFASRVDEHFISALGLTLVRGRDFHLEDGPGAPLVGIVNEQFAKHYWPNHDPIGKRFRVANAKNAWVQVVGVTKTSKYLFIAEPPTEFVYLPYRQLPDPRMVMVVQTTGDPASLATPLRAVVHGLDANMPVFGVRTMDELYEMRATRVFNVLISTVLSLGLMGLSLAIVGLYGLVAYAASRRTREIGIRMAIGADSGSVMRLVLRQGVTLAVSGLLVGLAASVGAGRVLAAAFPSGNDQRDFGALLIVIPIVLAVTSIAAYLPARRASRLDPTKALRHD